MDGDAYCSLVIKSKLTYKERQMSFTCSKSKEPPLTDLCTLHIVYIFCCTNVYYLWEFLCLQSKRIRHQRRQVSQVIQPPIASTAVSSKHASRTMSKRLAHLVQTFRLFQSGLYLSLHFTACRQQMLHLVFLRHYHFLNVHWDPPNKKGKLHPQIIRNNFKRMAPHSQKADWLNGWIIIDSVDYLSLFLCRGFGCKLLK